MSGDEIRLAVFGGTGEGKTSFVVRATDAPLEIGDGGDSCTQDVQIGSIMVGSKKVTLIDTPGFDDTESKDTDIFEKITVWLAKSRAHRKYLHGAILLQSVNDVRVPNSERKRTRLFKKIVGNQFYGRVAIVTTMWDSTEKSKCERGEQNRINIHEVWGDMLAAGAEVLRFQNTKQSALEIVRHYTDNPLFWTPATTLLQDELANNNALKDTAAASQFDSDVYGKTKELESTMASLGKTSMVENHYRHLQSWRRRLKNMVVKIWTGVVEVIEMAPNILDIANSCASM